MNSISYTEARNHLATTIDLVVENDVLNSGTIKSNNYLKLKANSMTNNGGVILSKGNVVLVSNEDFINKNGGNIKASDIQITSLDGNIINETFSSSKTIKQGVNNFTYTKLGNESKIEATNGDLVLQGANNIDIIGANLSASKNLVLDAKNDVSLKTIELKNEHNIYYKGGYDKALEIINKSSTASAGENVIINSGNNINLEASKINVKSQERYYVKVKDIDEKEFNKALEELKLK